MRRGGWEGVQDGSGEVGWAGEMERSKEDLRCKLWRTWRLLGTFGVLIIALYNYAGVGPCTRILFPRLAFPAACPFRGNSHSKAQVTCVNLHIGY